MLWMILAGSALAADPCDDQALAVDYTNTLRELHEADNTSAGRDERLVTVRDLDEAGLFCTAEMEYLAARMLRKGSAQDAARALELAEQAYSVRYPKSAWLVAVSADRVAADRAAR